MLFDHKAHFLSFYLKTSNSPNSSRVDEMVAYINAYYSNVSIQKAMALILCNQKNISITEADKMIDAYFENYKKVFLKYALTASNSPIIIRYKDIYKHIQAKSHNDNNGWADVFQKELKINKLDAEKWLEKTYNAFTQDLNPVSLQQKKQSKSKSNWYKKVLFSLLIMLILVGGYFTFNYYNNNQNNLKYYCISASGVKMRKDATSTASDIGSLTYGKPVTIISVDSVMLWTKINTEQGNSFIAMYYYLLNESDFKTLKKIIPDNFNDAMSLPSQVKYAMVNFINTNPGNDYEILRNQTFYYSKNGLQVVLPNGLKVNRKSYLILQEHDTAILLKIEALENGAIITEVIKSLEKGAYFKSDGKIQNNDKTINID